MIRNLRRGLAVALIIATASLSAVERRGADLAYPAVAGFLAGLPLKAGSNFVFGDSETEELIALSASQGINVFELIDCVARYVKTLGARVTITGESLRKTERRFKLGDERVLAILPVENLNRLEIGTPVSKEQKEADIYLDSEYESFIEIGKAHYKTRFGFASLSPLVFDDCYGVQVSRFLISTPLERLELYAPAKGAIYVKGISKPKRWNLSLISER